MIKVVGWYGHKNIGDESYRLTFPILFPDQTLAFSDRPEYEDFIIVGGGDILSHDLLSQLKQIKTKKIILSSSVSIETPFDLLDQFSSIFVRDKFSHDLLSLKKVPSQFLPDTAFLLSPNKENGKKLLSDLAKEEETELYEKKIAIVFNAHLMHSGKDDILARDFLNFHKVCNDLAKLADGTMASFIFLPMCTGMPYDDRVANSLIASKCKFFLKNLLVYDRFSVQETLDLISAVDGVISTRFHATLFSMISEVPFLDLVHHDKNINFLQTVGLSHLSLSYWDFKQSELKSSVEKLLEKKDIDAISSAYQEQLSILRSEMCTFPLMT